MAEKIQVGQVARRKKGGPRLTVVQIMAEGVLLCDDETKHHLANSCEMISETELEVVPAANS